MRFLPPSILSLLLVSAQPILTQSSSSSNPETDHATIYIQPLDPSSSSSSELTPLLTLAYNPSILSSTIQEYFPPSDLPPSSTLALLGILDPLSPTPSPKPNTSTTLLSLENFARGYTPTFLVTLDHEGRILGASAKSGVVDAGATRDFGPKVRLERVVRGKGPSLGPNIVLYVDFFLLIYLFLGKRKGKKERMESYGESQC
ncbi:hypothetical protein ACMFMG_002517 [Clarireedia jacksonii]